MKKKAKEKHGKDMEDVRLDNTETKNVNPETENLIKDPLERWFNKLTFCSKCCPA